jgi:hypothetical protein
MTDAAMNRARERIAAQKGRLTGWRPMILGNTAIVALQVLGMARGGGAIGLNVVVAGRSDAAIDAHGLKAAEVALRKRAVLADADRFDVVRESEIHAGDGQSNDPIRWPWRTIVVHVPERQLPSIAGLATDTVPTD